MLHDAVVTRPAGPAVKTDSCSSRPCLNGATCSVNTVFKKLYDCLCVQGYEGFNCELLITTLTMMSPAVGSYNNNNNNDT